MFLFLARLSVGIKLSATWQFATSPTVNLPSDAHFNILEYAAFPLGLQYFKFLKTLICQESNTNLMFLFPLWSSFQPPRTRDFLTLTRISSDARFLWLNFKIWIGAGFCSGENIAEIWYFAQCPPTVVVHRCLKQAVQCIIRSAAALAPRCCCAIAEYTNIQTRKHIVCTNIHTNRLLRPHGQQDWLHGAAAVLLLYY